MIEEVLQKHKFTEVADLPSFEAFCADNPNRLLFIYFYAKWNRESLDVLAILKEYLEGYMVDCAFAFVDSNSPANSKIVGRFKVEVVPTAVLASSDGELIKTLDKIDPNTVYQEIESQVQLFKQNLEIQRVRSFNKINKILKSSKLVVFLEEEESSGSRQPVPRDRSRSLLTILDENRVRYTLHKIVAADKDVAKWVFEISKHKELPLLFSNGKFVGGLDRIALLHSQGTLASAIPGECILGDSRAELDAILREERLVMLNKSAPALEPSVVDSEAAIKWLIEKLVVFRNYDLAKDLQMLEFVAQTFKSPDGSPLPLPLLFLDGSLIAGGQQLVRELASSPSKIPAELFGQDEFSDIRRIVGRDRVVVFIKGTRSMPECGFTSRILSLLDGYRLKYTTFDIIRDEAVREKAKQFANWKTFPMLFIDGEFVGGIDIVTELIEEGEFEVLIKDIDRV